MPRVRTIAICCGGGVWNATSANRQHCTLLCGGSYIGSGRRMRALFWEELWGHWESFMGSLRLCCLWTVGLRCWDTELSVPLRLLRARAGLSRCSWTISLPPSSCLLLLSLHHVCSLTSPHPLSILKWVFYYTKHCCHPEHTYPNAKKPCSGL